MAGGWRSFLGVFGWASGPVLPGLDDSWSPYAVTAEDVRLWILPPDMVRDDSSVLVDHYLKCRLQQGVLGQDTLNVEVPWDSASCTTLYGGTKLRLLGTGWEGCALELSVRGDIVFDGAITDGDEQWEGSLFPGAEYEHPGSVAKLFAVPWFTALTKCRVVRTSSGARFTATDYPKNIFRTLVLQNMVAGGSLETPTGYQQGTETRDDFGDITVAAGSTVSTGTMITFEAEEGENLYTCLLRLCNTPDTDAEKLWPTGSRSGTTVTLSCDVGRSGGSRGIGADLSSSLFVSAARGNLSAYGRKFSRTRQETHITGAGRGTAVGQRRRYKASATAIAASGVKEGWWTLPQGKTNAELDAEAGRRLFEYQDGTVTHTLGIRELPGFLWPTNWGIGDSFGVYTPRGESLAPLINNLVFECGARGPAKLEVGFGQMPPSPEAERARHGGGGAGGGGGGGANARKSGEISSWWKVVTQNGTVQADEPQDELSIKGKDTSTYIRAVTYGTDPGDADGTQEAVTIEIVGDYVASDPGVNSHMLVRLASGGSYKLVGHTVPALLLMAFVPHLLRVF